MRRWHSATMTILTAAAVATLWTVPVSTRAPVAAQAAPAGSSLYSTYCMVCHGADAKGDGALASSLKVKPTDLTQLTKRNDGIFPADMLVQVIDGKTKVRGHGGGDMPVWGEALLNSQDGGTAEAVKSRIDALVSYLERLQPKS